MLNLIIPNYNYLFMQNLFRLWVFYLVFSYLYRIYITEETRELLEKAKKAKWWKNEYSET